MVNQQLKSISTNQGLCKGKPVRAKFAPQK